MTTNVGDNVYVTTKIDIGQTQRLKVQ